MKRISVFLAGNLCVCFLLAGSGCGQQDEPIAMEEKEVDVVCQPRRPDPVCEYTPKEATPEEQVQMEVMAHSVQNRPIRMYTYNEDAGNPILIFGGFHGNERSSVYVAQQLVDLLERCPSFCGGREVVIVPNVNPDGRVSNTRRNHRKIDLNRNFPTNNWKSTEPSSYSYGGPKPLCEPESRAVYDLVRAVDPAVIISIHSISRGRECNNYDGPAEALAEAMSRLNGYPPKASIGYPTPGSFGTWAGKELEIPTITLELPRNLPNEPAWAQNKEALLKAIQDYPVYAK